MSKTQNLSHRPDYVAHLPKSDHNLSHDFSFTSSTGHILPLDYQLMNVGERISYTPHIYARSNPLLTAAMLDVDVHIDTFFVPAQMLFTAWDAIRWQVNDPISSFWASKFKSSSVDMPLIDIESCIGNGATGAAITDYWSDYLARFTGLETFTSLSRFTMFDCVAKEQFRLLNHFRLALGSAFVLSGQTPYYVNSNPRAFYMYLLAYQACFENYFRLDDWEKKNVSSYNVDHAYVNDGSYITSNPWILRMIYRPWKLDYFTKNMNNPISSFRNMLGNSSTVTPANALSSIDNYLNVSPHSQPKIYDDSSAPLSSALHITQYGLPQTSGNNQYVTTASIRSLFAVEKLNRIIGRTAKDYDSQVLAHFGFKVPHDVKHQLTHLSHSHGLLHVGEVIATADTQNASGGSALGSIAGKGYIIMKGKTTKFTAPTDGIFISLWSAVPRVRYIDTVDKSNFITSRLSLFIPEFDKLGAQPIYQYETDQAYMSLTGRYGWQRRYAQFKEKPNVATLAFVIPRNTSNVNQYSSYVASRRIYGGSGAGFYADYYCPPTALNANMVVQYDTAWSTDYETKPWLIYQQDPFVVDYHSDMYLVSSMSNWSEPDLD